MIAGLGQDLSIGEATRAVIAADIVTANQSGVSSEIGAIVDTHCNSPLLAIATTTTDRDLLM